MNCSEGDRIINNTPIYSLVKTDSVVMREQN